MRILILGSEGSLMQTVIPKLLAEGHTVVGIDNLFRYGERRESAKKLPYTYINWDASLPWYANQGAPMIELMGVDIIIQAAARIFGIGGFNKYEADILSFDVAIQHNLLSAIIKYRPSHMPRVIYISSSMVYETCGNPRGGVTENMPEENPPCKTGYGLSKYMGERLLKAYHKQYDMQYIIWRPFNIITPHEPADKEDIGISHVFADFIENIVIQKKNPLPIIGDGHQVRCFTWIDDVADAITNNLGFPALNHTFNIGNTKPCSMRALAEEIYTRAGVMGLIDSKLPLTFETIKEYPNDVRWRVPNCEAAAHLLGWKATKNTEDSIQECLNYLTIL